MSLLTADIKVGIIQQQLENLIPKFWSFLWAAVLALIVFFLGTKIIKLVLKIFKKAMGRKSVDVGVVSFLESLIKWVLYIILLTIILGLFGVTTTSISAAVAGIGVTAGLALQGALSNFAGGVLILVVRPFKVGDYIITKSSDAEGMVEKISIIYTTLKTIDGCTVQVPNGELAASTIINCTTATKRMVNETVGIAYGSDLAKAKEILTSVATNQEYRIKEEPYNVFVAELAESSVKLGIRFWVSTDSYWAAKWDTLEEIKNRFDKEGIEIAFNQLDVNLKQSQ
ncbi:MAG: mechanosensitive ion channel [Pseudobutyrivibrio sp.]|nr:mechanosensitive ion channel [Pseudobutyrivibrio sp.]